MTFALSPGLLVGIGYCALFVAAVVGLFVWRVRMRKERPPQEFVLLRGPGESLRQRIAKMDEDMPMHFVGALVAGPIVAGAVFEALRRGNPWLAVWVALAVLVVGFAGGVAWMMRGFFKRRDYLLGYLGERAVGEELGGPAAKGYFIFHDVPAAAGGRTFNVDHVVVGPTGLFAIETKTRRKRKAREGRKDYEVTFDGRQLIWPWGEETKALRQTEDRARWLSEWLAGMIGGSVTATPMLALPGWWVELRGKGAVNVQNAKNLPSAILGRGVVTLEPERIELIRRQLDARCRDVKD